MSAETIKRILLTTVVCGILCAAVLRCRRTVLPATNVQAPATISAANVQSISVRIGQTSWNDANTGEDVTFAAGAEHPFEVIAVFDRPVAHRVEDVSDGSEGQVLLGGATFRASAFGLVSRPTALIRTRREIDGPIYRWTGTFAAPKEPGEYFLGIKLHSVNNRESGVDPTKYYPPETYDVVALQRLEIE